MAKIAKNTILGSLFFLGLGGLAIAVPAVVYGETILQIIFHKEEKEEGK